MRKDRAKVKQISLKRMIIYRQISTLSSTYGGIAHQSIAGIYNYELYLSSQQDRRQSLDAVNVAPGDRVILCGGGDGCRADRLKVVESIVK